MSLTQNYMKIKTLSMYVICISILMYATSIHFILMLFYQVELHHQKQQKIHSQNKGPVSSTDYGRKPKLYCYFLTALIAFCQ